MITIYKLKHPRHPAAYSALPLHTGPLGERHWYLAGKLDIDIADGSGLSTEEMAIFNGRETELKIRIEKQSSDNEHRHREAKERDEQRYDAEYDRATGIPKFGEL